MDQWISSSAETTFAEIQHLDVSDKIQLHEKIALGGHSDVWVGTLDSVDGQLRVAIKELRVRHHQSNMPHEERLRRRFFREVALWARLHHPNIVPLLGFSVSAGSLPKLISPWYTNGNIVNYLQKQPDAERPKLLLDVAYAISYLHSLPLVHGDIKGDNILIDANGSAILCDFGMSKFIDEALHITGFTTTGQTGGTPRLMAPELLEDQPKTTMTDVWAFGCAAIQIMTDLVPYPHISTIMAVQMAIIRGESPFPPHYEASTSQEASLWKEVKKCWTLPSQRPSINILMAHIDSTFFNSTKVGTRASSSNELPDEMTQRRLSTTLAHRVETINHRRMLEFMFFNPDLNGNTETDRTSPKDWPLPHKSPEIGSRTGQSIWRTPEKIPQSSSESQLATFLAEPNGSSSLPGYRTFLPLTSDASLRKQFNSTNRSDPSIESREVPSSTNQLTATEIRSMTCTLITVTQDGDIHYIVDVTDTENGMSIRRRIYSELLVSIGEESSFEIYIMGRGKGRLGTPITDEQLVIYCSEWGDDKGTLKFFVERVQSTEESPAVERDISSL